MMMYRVTVRWGTGELRGYVNGEAALTRIADALKGLAIVIASPTDEDYDPFASPPEDEERRAFIDDAAKADIIDKGPTVTDAAAWANRRYDAVLEGLAKRDTGEAEAADELTAETMRLGLDYWEY